MKNIKLFFIFYIGILLFLNSCASDEKKLERILTEMIQAVNEKDLELYLSFYSKDYWDSEKIIRYQDIAGMLVNIFDSWQDIKLEIYEKSIYISGDTARVVQNFFIEGNLKGVKKAFSGKKESIFQKDSSRTFKVINGFLLEPLYNYSSPERDEIIKVIKTRIDALNQKNVEKYLSCISPTYNDLDSGKDFQKIKEGIEERFAKWESISMKITAIQINIAGNRATVDESFSMVGKIEGEIQEFPNGREYLELVKNQELGWRIVKGL